MFPHIFEYLADVDNKEDMRGFPGLRKLLSSTIPFSDVTSTISLLSLSTIFRSGITLIT